MRGTPLAVGIIGLLLLAAVAPAATGHNALDAINRHRAAFVLNGSTMTLKLYQCDNLYRLLTNPEDNNDANQFCVEKAILPSGQTSKEVNSLFPAVAVETDGSARASYDCRAKITNAAWAGTAWANLTAAQESTPGSCSFTFARLDTLDSEVADIHWSKQNDAVTPALHINDMRLRWEHGCCTDTLKWTFFWWNADAAPLSLAFLQDDAQTDTYHSVSPNIHEWNISDPGGDDRLFQAGQDITPPVGGTADIAVGVTAERSDAGGGDVIWRIKSSLGNTYPFVRVDDARPGYYDWYIYTQLG